MASFRFGRTRGGAGTFGGFAGGGLGIVGTKQLERKLRYLGTRGARRVVAAGVAAAMPQIAKGFREAVNMSPASPQLKRAARRTVGWRFRRGGTNRAGRTTKPIAKAGFAVGTKKQRAKRIRAAKAARQKRIQKGKQADRGVGISAANIHWAVLGSKERFHKSGHPTGRMPAFFLRSGEKALSLAGERAVSAAVARMRTQLAREAKSQVRA